MNACTLTGRLTNDPEIRTTDNSSIAKFTLAVDRKFKREGDTQTADFINCVAFGKQAEFIGKYFNKGMKMDLTGRIQTGSYTNKDNVKVYTFDVVVESAEFGERKGSGNNNTAPKQDDEGFDTSSGFEQADDLELPFN